MPQFISDEEIEKALDYLRDNASLAAKAKAERFYVIEYRKVIKSQIMQEHNSDSAVIQQRHAYADPRYLQHLEAIREAIKIDEQCQFLRSAAEAKINAWQTMSANERAHKI